MATWRPVVALLVLAPVLGEGLSAATPPLELLLPWNLALFVALYGCGALLCRELARRHRLGAPGLVLLAAAYSVYEEALVDRFWFSPQRWHDAGLGDYAVVWHTQLLMAAHLASFHICVSIGGSVVVVERIFPAHADEAWLGRRGLVVATAVLLVVPPLLFGEYDAQPLPQLLAAGALLVVLVALASRVRPSVRTVRSVRAPGATAFACTAAHFVLTYSVPHLGVPWPVGTAIALAPVVAGVLLLRAADAARVVTGVLAFFCLLCVLVGLAGRYDTTVLGLVGGAALVWWRRRATRARPAC